MLGAGTRSSHRRSRACRCPGSATLAPCLPAAATGPAEGPRRDRVPWEAPCPHRPGRDVQDLLPPQDKHALVPGRGRRMQTGTQNTFQPVSGLKIRARRKSNRVTARWIMGHVAQAGLAGPQLTQATNSLPCAYSQAASCGCTKNRKTPSSADKKMEKRCAPSTLA